ncbi:hypothetical protein K1T73_09125 [Roseovarius sp. SCSIO 43702]|uniref:hypothetical protein n=1 Tax=Roseovarius sp. SCSIO 43702 TaxID=2823043 RepID=UPI001C72DB62|nr:hypothetical protein [Roseovarius sp. SCSIO 43702]QYX55282.1 hypothetical protein K1T73_09125 [Roseovarius sp. SCSIO 43702]
MTDRNLMQALACGAAMTLALGAPAVAQDMPVCTETSELPCTLATDGRVVTTEAERGDLVLEGLISPAAGTPASDVLSEPELAEPGADPEVPGDVEEGALEAAEEAQGYDDEPAIEVLDEELDAAGDTGAVEIEEPEGQVEPDLEIGD